MRDADLDQFDENTEPAEAADGAQNLTLAYHHLHRAAAVIPLLQTESSDDLRTLLEDGMKLYHGAVKAGAGESSVNAAFGLLRAAEHLGMASLYAQRSEHRVKVAPPSRRSVAAQLNELGPRLEALGSPDRENAQRLCSMARDLLQRASSAEHDPHLEYELTMAAEGICTALEHGV